MTPLLVIVAASLLGTVVLLAIQAHALPAGTVDPFAAPPRDASSDTVASALTRTAPPAARPAGEWHTRVVTSLREVETLLDYLEACGVATRAVDTIGEEGFAVRWQ